MNELDEKQWKIVLGWMQRGEDLSTANESKWEMAHHSFGINECVLLFGWDILFLYRFSKAFLPFPEVSCDRVSNFLQILVQNIRKVA